MTYIYCLFVLVNDTLEDALGESGDEEESDAIVTQVLDEIGIEISGKVSISVSVTVPVSTTHPHIKLEHT